MTIVRTALLALTAAVLAASQGFVASAQTQTLSDESVKRLMDYAWLQTPAVYTERDGKKIQIDKKDRTSVMIPVEIARDIIIAGRRSALAQICKLDEDMLRNHRSLMKRETGRAPKWSDQQVVYINMLHLTTVQIFTGDLTITIEEGGKRKIVDTEPDKKRKPTCTETEASKLKEQIEAYVAQGPKLEEAPATKTTTAPVKPTSNPPPAKKP